MEIVHEIRLHGPWEFHAPSPTDPNAIATHTIKIPGPLIPLLPGTFLLRRFGKPTGLTSSTTLTLRIGSSQVHEVRVNDQACPSNDAIWELPTLAERNTLQVFLNPTEQPTTVTEIILEIRDFKLN